MFPCFRLGAAACLASFLLPAPAHAAAPASWLGGYDCQIREPQILYGIDIREEGGETIADIDGDGFQTMLRVRARVSGDENRIDLRFKEAREDNVMAFFEDGELLLALERRGGRLVTQWGGIMPGRAPEVCFAKEGASTPGAPAAGQEGDPLGAVSGLGEAAARWDEAVRKALQTFDGLSPAEADKLYAADASPLKQLEESPAYQDVDRASQPLFARWAKAGFDDARLDPADRACFAELARHGLAKDMSEGTPFFRVDQGAIEEPLYGKLSSAMAGYARLLKRQPASFVSDAALRFSVREMLGWAREWEQFILSCAQGQARSAAIGRYRLLMDFCLFSALDNSPAFFRDHMSDGVRRDLQEGAQRFKGYVTGRLAGDYLKDVAKNGWKYSKATERRHRELLLHAFD